MNQLDAMRIYLRVADTASFTLAAQQLGLPKASVSMAVRRLENLLGTRLLARTTRRVAMTPDGQAFYERCQDLLSDVDEVQGMFRETPARLRGRLRVDLPVAVACQIVMPRLPAFLAQHPELVLEVSATDRRVDLVREGFDCVLRIGELTDSSLVARPLGGYRQINCASPDYLARHGVPATPGDLTGHCLIHYASMLGARTPGFEYRDPASGVLHTVPMSGGLTVNHSGAYVAACVAGLGLIQNPVSGVREHLDAGRLVEVLPDYCPPPLPVTLLYGHRRHLPLRLRVFMTWLAEVMAPSLATE